MKLLRFGRVGEERPGILDDDGQIRDLSGQVADISGDILSDAALQKLREIEISNLPIVSPNVRIGPCVANVGKLICIGLNYADHAAETGVEVPEEPVVFMKATSSICGPNDDIVKPKGSTKLDWEIELGIIIGKEARYVSEADAEQHIAGFCVINDISERAFQLEQGGQWTKGKGCDTFGPIGPYLVTREEVSDPQNLDMWLEVNENRFQDGSSNTMVHKPNFIVSYLSRFMSLQPGDVISTGTPPGVGLGQKPPQYLSVGDQMFLGISGLGVQNQTVVSYLGDA